VTKREGGRLGRLFGREDATVDESVALSGNDDHAWWADRRTLAGAPGAPHMGDTPIHDDAPPDPEPEAAPEADRWSVESLFADARTDPVEPPPPPPEDDGATTMIVATGLDQARLVLGVGPEATRRDVTQAHRALAKQFHPDRLGALSPEAQELGQHRMSEINLAYATLREVSLR
jgi:hypothetical protein